MGEGEAVIPEHLDRVAVRGISATGHHGVFDFEKREGQTFVVDVVLGMDTREAAATDDLAKTVNYAEVAADVVALIEAEPVDLIEKLAQQIAVPPDQKIDRTGCRRDGGSLAIISTNTGGRPALHASVSGGDIGCACPPYVIGAGF